MQKEINRRAFLRQSASVAAVAVAVAVPTVAVAGIAGLDEGPRCSNKFRGPGWYVFGEEGIWGQRVMYAGAQTHWGFIPLSEREGEEVVLEMSPRTFDRTCIWIMQRP